MMQNASKLDLKQLLKQAGYRHAGEEQEKLEELLEMSGDSRVEFLRWVFEEHIGFVDTRKQAGLYYWEENHDDALRIIEALIHSDDPDDRDTASEVLQEINVPRSYELIKILLTDPWPYLQFDACDFLKEKYPAEVKEILMKLSNHEDERVRKVAKRELELLL